MCSSIGMREVNYFLQYSKFFALLEKFCMAVYLVLKVVLIGNICVYLEPKVQS